MGLAPPPPLTTNPAVRFAADLRNERRVSTPWPPGDRGFDLARTRRFARDPLPVLLEAYERWGPVFTLRVLHEPVVFMIGPAANHFVLVSHADRFRWRDGHMGDLIPLLGDGLLTIDGDFHRRSRRAMLPVFHRERIAAATATMREETERAVARFAPGARLDLYRWTRAVALRIAMRALFGLDPERSAREVDAVRAFEQALGFYARDYLLQVLRGPGTPFWRMKRARAQLDRVILAEVARRRATGRRGDDLLSLLLDAEDEEGRRLDDQHVRDEVMTLLFAGHDTTTSTVAFLFYELARHPDIADDLAEELRQVVGARALEAADVDGTALPRLEMAIDETLRKYPPAWVGPRRSARAFTFAGCTVPANVAVNYSSWVTHHLADFWPEPGAFRPERFSEENRARIVKGAYVPFGAGSRICIGMRFGQAEVRTIAASILRRWRLRLDAGFELSIRQMPTISPRDGLPVAVEARRAA